MFNRLNEFLDLNV